MSQELPFSLICMRGCWYSTYIYAEMADHMSTYRHDDDDARHRTRCGCCNNIFSTVHDLWQHLFESGTSAFERHHITIFELIAVMILFKDDRQRFCTF